MSAWVYWIASSKAPFKNVGITFNRSMFYVSIFKNYLSFFTMWKSVKNLGASFLDKLENQIIIGLS